MRAFALLIVLSAPVYAQKPPEPPAAIKKPPVVVAGYSAYKIQGFTVFVSADILTVPAGAYARMPLEVLDGELATVVSVMDRKSVEALRRLVLWAEWDAASEGETGRGTPVAVYRGGSPRSLAQRDLHPLKSKSVDIVNMKSLTEEHQPERDSGRCVVLHEFAHAVHDQVIGTESPAIKAAFAQAMERRLYDKGQYATTNAAEFFAELSCSYLDRLNYHPATREELKNHDPATYKLMEKVWGPGLRKPPPPAETGGDSSLKLASLRFAETVLGDEVNPEALAGQTVLIVWYGGSQADALDRAERLRGELGDYGLTVIGAFHSSRAPVESLRADARRRSPQGRVVRGAFVPQGDGTKLFNQRPPLAMLFDTTGTNVYKGSVFSADAAIRAAVGANLVAGAWGTEPVPGTVKPVSDAFRAGATPVAVLPKLAPLLASADAETRAAATRLQAAIVKPLAARYEAAVGQEKTDPAAAFVIAERLAEGAKGTAEGAKARALAERLRRTPPVANELQARIALTPIRKLAGRLRAQDGAYDPQSEAFQARHAVTLVQLKNAAGAFRVKYANTPALAELDKEVGEFGL